MRTYFVIWVANRGGCAVLLLDGKEVHRTAPSAWPDICGQAWMNNQFHHLLGRAA